MVGPWQCHLPTPAVSVIRVTLDCSGAKAMREQMALSQAVFARLLNVPKVTEISWEKGRRKPTGAALRLLDLVRRKPNILQEA